ncbi:unnamed protein product [Acanthoscelides obtectus]|uniref:Uncharacterized protein n=1 Tax=Acanthoscelides obtectus TaxID=200917 RepID=A0A9P0PPY1_ACAOB|nr:unnamed protein product [Acanthoscelides obtectus]CAK1646505.1 hypothetical protein AOBTE_LOCUS14674 [Acanthoscelides obtectus]
MFHLRIRQCIETGLQLRIHKTVFGHHHSDAMPRDPVAPSCR